MSNTTLINYPLPEKYDVLYGYFFDKYLNENKNKIKPLYIETPHYMIVLHVFEDIKKMLVIVGTSIKDDLYFYKYQKQDLIIKRDNDLLVAGLEVPTLFSINGETIGIIDSTSFFLKPKGLSPIVGKLSQETISEYREILDKNPQINKIGQYLNKEGKRILDPEEFEIDEFFLLCTWKMEIYDE